MNDGAGQVAGEQPDPSQRRQRQAVQEAGLDVPRQIGAGVDRREQRALHEREAQ